MGVKIDSINFVKLEKKLAGLTDDKTMLEVHNAFAKFMEPYVPMDEGILAHSASVTKDFVQYQGPYAHYQYEGVVYGPNLPFKIANEGKKNERFEFNSGSDFLSVSDVIWRSPPGKKKYPTDRKLKYSKEKHPLATDHWDKVMLRDKGDEFREAVKKILLNKLKEGGGNG